MAKLWDLVGSRKSGNVAMVYAYLIVFEAPAAPPFAKEDNALARYGREFKAWQIRRPLQEKLLSGMNALADLKVIYSMATSKVRHYIAPTFGSFGGDTGLRVRPTNALENRHISIGPPSTTTLHSSERSSFLRFHYGCPPSLPYSVCPDFLAPGTPTESKGGRR
ncbi:hypothetical protein CPB85DRAFT_1441841 [Mucidula mucida]|nr:hypothetical protein CPB85DRAFT_1441841 [Mucidula mucida]